MHSMEMNLSFWLRYHVIEQINNFSRILNGWIMWGQWEDPGIWRRRFVAPLARSIRS